MYPEEAEKTRKIDISYILIEIYARPAEAIEKIKTLLHPLSIQDEYSLETSWMVMVTLYGIYNHSDIIKDF